MTLGRGGVAVACVLAALVSGGCGLMRSAVMASMTDEVNDAEVNVAPEEILVRFPAAAATSWACSAPAAGGRQYAWTVRLDGSEPWHAIDVRAVLPASAADPGRSISPILDQARATVSRMAGTPPVPVEAESTPVTAFAVGDTALVVRITDRAAIRRVARGRPLSATLMACADGDDTWTRDVPVRYDPRF